MLPHLIKGSTNPGENHFNLHSGVTLFLSTTDTEEGQTSNKEFSKNEAVPATQDQETLPLKTVKLEVCTSTSRLENRRLLLFQPANWKNNFAKISIRPPRNYGGRHVM